MEKSQLTNSNSQINTKFQISAKILFIESCYLFEIWILDIEILIRIVAGDSWSGRSCGRCNTGGRTRSGSRLRKTILLREKAHQVLLDLIGISCFRQSEPVSKAFDVCVHRDPSTTP